MGFELRVHLGHFGLESNGCSEFPWLNSSIAHLPRIKIIPTCARCLSCFLVSRVSSTRRKLKWTNFIVRIAPAATVANLKGELVDHSWMGYGNTEAQM